MTQAYRVAGIIQHFVAEVRASIQTWTEFLRRTKTGPALGKPSSDLTGLRIMYSEAS